MDYCSAETVHGHVRPRRHRRAAQHFWQFQIFVENWAKLPRFDATGENLCGTADSAYFIGT
jgi:hypothetical protein